MTLAITRNDLSSDEMRLEARRSKDSRVSRRLLALAEILDGRSRAEAARTGCVQRQTLRDWVCLYNAEGIAGLRDRPRSGRRARLSAAHLAALSALVEAGPDVAVHGVVRWRCVDLCEQVKSRFDVELSERQMGRILNQRKFTRLTVRAQHPKADEAAQTAFKKTSPRS